MFRRASCDGIASIRPSIPNGTQFQVKSHAITAVSFCFLLVAACRNVVVVENSGSGVGGASGVGHSAGANATGSTGTLATSAATGIPQTTCDTFCNLASNCLPSCHRACEAYGVSPCQAQGQALANCLAAHFDPMTCGVVGCDQETQAFTQCRSTVPQQCAGGGGGSGGGPDSFECAMTYPCAGGDERVMCESQGQAANCTCYLNYLQVGTCSASVPSTQPPDALVLCDAKKGCCAQFFGT